MWEVGLQISSFNKTQSSGDRENTKMCILSYFERSAEKLMCHYWNIVSLLVLHYRLERLVTVFPTFSVTLTWLHILVDCPSMQLKLFNWLPFHLNMTLDPPCQHRPHPKLFVYSFYSILFRFLSPFVTQKHYCNILHVPTNFRTNGTQNFICVSFAPF